ncbi:MAG: 30S ribosomal protein S8 [Verrucomicrobia bacterium Tous-C9LFEB]|nr:MAG: 30S ribosomal protein S8 [Verrucomicrobia bacterium Tous-C9LFEB]
MQTDPLGDFLTTLRNASRSAKSEVVTNYSRMKSDVAHILKREGYVSDVEVLSENKAKPQLKVVLKGNGKSRAIVSITRLSKPGLRRYVNADNIPNILGGMGVSVVSTSQGVLAGHEAKKRRLGGELLLSIY